MADRVSSGSYRVRLTVNEQRVKDRDGVSATARQAACANWFDGPTMKLSKVCNEDEAAGAGGGAVGSAVSTLGPRRKHNRRLAG